MQAEGVEYIELLRLADDEQKPGSSDAIWIERELVSLADWEVPSVAAVTLVPAGVQPPAPGQNLAPPPVTPPVPVPVPHDEC
jgi:hypothetical protein